MRLTARPLINVGGVNSYTTSQQVAMFTGDAADFYFQLVDLDKNLGSCGNNPPGLRYMPQANATLALTFINIDSAKQFTRYATQPFPQDPSIWLVSLLATDPITGTVSMRGLLTEIFNSAPKTKAFALQACVLASVT